MVGHPLRETQRIVGQLRQIADQRVFVERYPEIDQRFQRSSPWLAHAWSEFHESLLMPADHGVAVIRNTSRPGDYLNRESCRLVFPIWHAVPKYFVGVGLLITFIGLVAGLYFAGGTVGGDVREATAGLRNLLDGATLKFLASIAGLSCSIIFSIVYHKEMKALDGGFEKLSRELERLMEFTTPEAIAD